MTTNQTTNIVIAALGGEGGGTLVSWIEEVAHNCGWYAQATSIAGVAQRTGATIYYIELFPGRDDGGPAPVMSMFPTAGDIDIAISSEIAEAGRLIQRGFCTRDRTTLVTSDHHVFGITEKIELGQSSVDTSQISEIAKQQCKNMISFDMHKIAEDNATVISASLFGALAGAKVLPFKKSDFQQVIEASAKMVENNLAAFNSSYNKAIAPPLVVEAAPKNKASERVTNTSTTALPKPSTEHGIALAQRIEKEFPPQCHRHLTFGVARLLDYQDLAYAEQYLDLMAEISALDDGANNSELSNECARHLALWMSFEDTARVAQIKTRASRQAKIRKEVRAEDKQILHVTEFFAPRLEELCQPLPAPLARKILASPRLRRISSKVTKGRRLRTDTALSFTLLRIMAWTRKWRRSSYTFQDEHRAIKQWLSEIKRLSAINLPAATELSKAAKIIKGYGATRERGSEQFAQILTLSKQGKLDAKHISHLVDSALADDEGKQFNQTLANYG